MANEKQHLFYGVTFIIQGEKHSYCLVPCNMSCDITFKFQKGVNENEQIPLSVGHWHILSKH